MSGEANAYYAGGTNDVEQGRGAPPGPYANGSGQPQQQFGEKQNYDQVFKAPKRKFKDAWAGILFLATVGGFAAVSAIALRTYATHRSATGSGIYNGSDDSNFGLNTNTIICMIVCVAVAVVLSTLYMCIARAFTKTLIWVTGICNIALGLATAIYMLYERYWSGGIVFLIFSVFNIICFISWIPRIPFSVEMLRASIDVSRRYGHVYIVSLVGGLLSAAFGVWFSITMVAVYVRWEPGNSATCTSGNCSKAKVIGLMAFITFAGYWITEWLKNTIHASIAGVYGAWFYAPNDAAFPRGATRGAAKRALTRSFGSISLGSLVVAIINSLRQLCSIAQRQASQSNDMITSILLCFVGCFLMVLDWAVQFVNRYAFCNIALYGSTYFEAARDTWTMLKDRGIDALANTCLVGPVFSMGATFVAYATALSAYVFLKVTSPAYNSSGSYTPVIVAYAFLVGLQICNVFTVPISSGVDTIFVAMGWDPYVMRQHHTELFERLVRVNPHVQNAVQGERWQGVGRH